MAEAAWNKIDHAVDQKEMDAQIRNLRSSGIDSAHEQAGAFWNRILPPFEHRNAVFEILAQQPT